MRIIYLPKSEKLYLELIKLEKNDNEKKKILKKCLFEKIPTSEILWKILIELEKNNPEIYKRLLIKCTEYFPKSINSEFKTNSGSTMSIISFNSYSLL